MTSSFLIVAFSYADDQTDYELIESLAPRRNVLESSTMTAHTERSAIPLPSTLTQQNTIAKDRETPTRHSNPVWAVPFARASPAPQAVTLVNTSDTIL
jgi:hypothetical protein